VPGGRFAGATDRLKGNIEQMEAALLTDIGKIEIRRVPEPRLTRPGDVKLRVETVGVCGSDMHYYRTGRIGDQVVEFPFAVGHELAATVVEAGPEAGGVSVGQRVAVDPLICCGSCDQCLSGREHTCRDQRFLGVPGQLDGALMEQIVMPARCCYPLPEVVSMDQGALAEPFSIGLYAQRLAGNVAGRTIAILGCGPIGLSVLMAVKAAGAAAVYMTDIRDYRADLAATLGADWTGNPRRQDVVQAVRKAEPRGVDVAYECAGEQETVDQCLELLTPGGKCMLVGIPELDRLSFDMNHMRRGEIAVQNVRRQNGCVGPAIEMIASGKADVGAMVTHHFTLAESQQAFETVAYYRDGVVKAIIDVTGER